MLVSRCLRVRSFRHRRFGPARRCCRRTGPWWARSACSITARRGAFLAKSSGGLAAVAAIAADVCEARWSRNRAEAGSAARVDLLADLGHELRTPLNGILGFTQLLRRDGLVDPRGLRSVERIEEAGRALLAMAGDTLDLARAGSDGVRLARRPFDVARLVEDAVAMVDADAERKGLGLVVDLPASPLGPLVGDPDRLRQVLLNLLSNAVKFTGSGTVRVSLAAGQADPPASPVPLTFVVEDSGIGFDGIPIPRLFQRFRPGGRDRVAAVRRDRPWPRHLQKDRRTHGWRHRRGRRSRARARASP